MISANNQSNFKANFTHLIDSSQYLSDHSKNDSDLDLYKFALELQTSIFKDDPAFLRKSERMAMCSNFLNFKVYADHHDDLHHKLHKANFCRVRNCPMCQYRRSMLLRSRFFKLVPKLPDNLEYLFLTFTVRNCEVVDLRETIAQMNKAWKRIIDLDSLHFDKWLVGWFRSVEVTRQFIDVSDMGDLVDVPHDKAHPHFHILLAVKPSYFHHHYISQAKWTDVWKKALRIDYTPIVNVKKVKLNQDDIAKISEDQLDDDKDVSKMRTLGIRRAVLEVSKYSVKPSDFFKTAFDLKKNDINLSSSVASELNLVTERDKYWFKTYCKQVHNLRFNSSGGLFKEFLAEIEEAYESGDDKELIFIDGDQVHVDDLQHVADSKYTVDNRVTRYALKTYAFADGSPLKLDELDDPLSNSVAYHRDHVDRLLPIEVTAGGGLKSNPNGFENRDHWGRVFDNGFVLKHLAYTLNDLQVLTLGYYIYSDPIYQRFRDYYVYDSSYKFMGSASPRSGGCYNNLTPHFIITYDRSIPF